MRHPFGFSSPLLRAASLGILVLGAACSSDSGTSSNTPSIKLTLHPTSATVNPGVSVPVTGLLTRTDFTGSVTITADGIPSGVTYSVTNVSTDSTTISLMVGSSTPVGGPYTINVHAAGAGVTTTTASFALTIATGPGDTISLARHR